MNDKQIPKYRQLKQGLLDKLSGGEWKAHDQMPSEHEIATSFGMSRQTVRQALGELEQEGWLYRLQGKGTFVSEPAATKTSGPVRTIGMMTTYISDYIFPHIVRGAEAALRDKGYRLMLLSTDNDKARERENLELLLGEPLSGLIIEPTRSAQGNPNLDLYLSLQVQGIPFVMINERYPELNCPCFRLDDEAGGYAAAEHLIRLGHRSIAGFFKTDDLQGANRLKGFLRALGDHGLPLRPDSVTSYMTEDGTARPYAAAIAMLEREDRPTALVAYNDQLAVRLLEAARQAKLSVPRELSIVGFDDSSLATATEVKLTTLTHPKSEMGRQAAIQLMDWIEDRQGAATDHAGPTRHAEKERDRLFAPELIVRGSTAAPHL
ncbi:GntR family transcriptional regulator, arabinose operon transcriptional repressor [Paenibacillus sp. UNCCL117]|uniref:GntR family transcriptional regulator n=1 Tax=unclassified Paenibacillus TaxID=185978 RepID=UPI00088F73CA|nr:MULTISPECIES: GntR family transcriptional regulator [unclassified Paenibacillus]SDD37937.1 transcriptional regulator, GntR family [Paenibacillus sp. cl123]SFW48688.1 GntR family transcriptional regulator, arabinose operon transcriptional repressor [Paenibacillus sp. UNCCL117]